MNYWILYIIITLMPNDPSGLLLGKQLYVQGQYDEAIIHLSNEPDIRARYYEGLCHVKLGDCVSASDELSIFINAYSGYGEDNWKLEAQKWIEKCAGAQLAQAANEVDKEPQTDILLKTNPVDSLKDMDDDIEEATISSIDRSDHYKVLFTASRIPDKTYLSIADMGPVTFEEGEDGLYLYYLGNFKTQMEATRIVKKVRESGYPDAQVIHFNQGEAVEQVAAPKPEFEPIMDRKPEIAAAKKPAPTKETPKPRIEELEVKEDITFHVLFRGLDNPYEEFPELKHLGPLFRDTYDKEGNTRYLIGEVHSKEEAEALLAKVKEVGYPVSFIASYKNGQLLKIYD